MFWNLIIGIAAFFLQLVLAPKPQNAKPASLADFQVPVAEEGVEIPVAFGTVNIKSPNVVWYGDLVLQPIKGARRYGFFGPRQVIGYHYGLGMHMVLCHSVHDEIREMWVGEKQIFPKAPSTTVFTGSGQMFIDQYDIFGGDEGEGGIGGYLDVAGGGPGQGASTYQKGVFAGDDTPGFLGVVSITWEHLYIGNTPYLKPWEFVLKRIHKTSRNATQWYDEKAAVPDAPADAPGSFVPDPNDEYAGATPNLTDYGNAVVDDYYVSRDGGDLICWKFPNLTTPLWTTAVSPDPQAVAASKNGYVFTAASTGTAEIKVWDITDGSLLATVTLTGISASNRGLSCYDDVSGTTYCCLFGNQWAMIAGSGSSWLQTGDINGPNWLTNFKGATVGQDFVYAIKGGSLTPTDNKIYRVQRGFISTSLVTEVLLSEVAGTIFGIGYDKTNDRAIVLDTDGYVHTYSANLSTHIASSPGSEGWIHSGGSLHAISNGMFSAQGICFVGQATGAKRCVVQYDLDANLISVTVSPDDVDYLNDLSDVTSSMVDAKNNFLVVWGLTTTVTAWEFPVAAVDALDMNPAHIIRECLTDHTWGMGYADADIDDDSFTAAADTLYDECFGLSLLWTREERIEEFISVILSHIDAYLYLKRTTGKFTLKLIRNDYVLGDLPVFNEDDVVSWDEVSRREPPEAVNSVIVKYTDRRNRGKDASISFDNIAQIQALGERINATRFYPGISRGGLAVRVAARDQKSLGIGMISGRLTGKRTWDSLNPGDPFRLVTARHNLDGEVMRVAALKFGDGRDNKIGVKFAQDVFHLNANELVDPAQGDWENPSNPPQVVTPRLVWEMPYLELKAQIGPSSTNTLLADNPDAGMIEAAGARPTSDTLDAAIYVDGVKEDVMTFAPAGLIEADIAAFDTAITITEGTDLTLLTEGMLAAIVGDTPETTEIVRIDTIAGNDLTLSRGMLDTIPRSHLAGSWLVAYDDFGMPDFKDRTAGDTPDVKLITRTTLGSLPLGSAPIDEVTLDSRAIRPLRPADAQVNGDDGSGLGEVDLVGIDPIPTTWARRNRLTESTPLAWTDADQTPEASQTTNLILLAADGVTVIDDVTYAGISGTSQDIDPADFGAAVSAYIVFDSERDGYTAWQAYRIHVRLAVATLTADPGSYTFTGTDATLNYSRKLAAAAGSYSLTGIDATLKHANLHLGAGAGSYTVTGTNASLLHGRTLVAGAGSYTLTGTNASLVLDIPFSAVKLLVGFEGTDASTTFTDESASPHTLTANGNAQVDTAQFKFGSASGLFDGTGDYISTGDSADWDLADANSDPYCLEVWARFNSIAGNPSLCCQNGGAGSEAWRWQVLSTGEMRWSFSISGAAFIDTDTSGAGITTGTWYHLAVDHDSTGKIRLFVDGVMRGSATPADSRINNATPGLSIGASSTSNGTMNGWLDELRITKGYSRYGSDSSFTPPTAAFPRS